MALDEPKETDSIFKFDGFEMIIDKDFLQKVHPIKVDFLTHGFKLDCNMSFKSACSSCSTTGTCDTE